MPLTEDFISYLIHEKRFSQHTVVAYQKDIEQFLEICCIDNDQELIETNHQVIRGFVVGLVDLGLENSSVNRKLSSIRSLFKYLRQQGKMEINPTVKVKSLKQKKVLPVFVPESELWDNSLFEQTKDEFTRILDETILETFYQTGIRLSELINLKVHNVQSNQIKVLGKRNKERIVPISERLNRLILNYRQLKQENDLNSEFFFITKKSKKLSPKLVYDKVNFYLGEATNLGRRSPHVLRHTFATHMLNNGASLESIKKLLGHADLSATQIYTHNSFAQIKSIYKQAHPRGA